MEMTQQLIGGCKKCGHAAHVNLDTPHTFCKLCAKHGDV